ncbi:bifunctional D-glycero-beta-D-manno-heptose-7-phosphate kinase/D-glycero-beta-D-manno-heptose 1-phosphate adenylyltransferase HldE [Siccirubricoccus sp. KC 17139]|uniref:Bifunctional protein HldE n=1 Tax=Siccirubricoccus soli TaxID=2899147 RepID=A0ABT1D2W5_9PROT|nr:bifunctional D-glycero-beta-D-manno-heptose-7-phosphate kinase/D-glycero-beta-D-manno-heptose 1-phosphate adenylyltransferase HldE [Siccirubricoccus soli]MCO6416268.1 bifunctional D-glycero-beta-D-manno-heptose-7-phosphate kinase/D-glycero-beta-D-manno-heptose 1-phosphate adenylyltransferase HldE [Siccirubricoccus soli]MCP2682402.1 bifunctional D-glycero-beta-D-manno-heptose-7-phosphate kinase/D-glycero-beta-D-manno-heptose 1-phosphate adenylyltransferase HldE [Siccirubricoccus soli]
MLDFSALRILVLGDVMLDRFLYGEVERISPEAPVPVLRQRRARAMPGGAGNVARNISALGGQAVLVGLVGQDAAAAECRALLAEDARIADALVASSSRPTVCKMRVIAGTQQVVRIDDEVTGPADAAEAAALVAAVEAALPGCGALILSDYAKGVLAPGTVAAAIAAAKARGVPVFADPKSEDFGLYRGADCLTPNARELARAARAPAGTEAEVEAAARRVMAGAGLPALLCTRAEKGMMLVRADGPATGVPAEAREVFDVSGAGDTVIATLALAHAAGKPLEEAMGIANTAAGIVVGKLGTATVSADELAHALRAGSGSAPGEEALLDWAAARRLVAEWKAHGLRVGFTNGCFDILHAGHVALLRAARRRCDRLVVGLNTDASVARLKGPERPVNSLADRAAVISALASVDAVVGFGQDTPLELIRLLLPDVLVKGADYSIEQVVGADVVQAAGGEVALIELVPGRSTTNTIARLRR